MAYMVSWCPILFLHNWGGGGTAVGIIMADMVSWCPILFLHNLGGGEGTATGIIMADMVSWGPILFLHDTGGGRSTAAGIIMVDTVSWCPILFLHNLGGMGGLVGLVWTHMRRTPSISGCAKPGVITTNRFTSTQSAMSSQLEHTKKHSVPIGQTCSRRQNVW